MRQLCHECSVTAGTTWQAGIPGALAQYVVVHCCALLVQRSFVMC